MKERINELIGAIKENFMMLNLICEYIESDDYYNIILDNCDVYYSDNFSDFTEKFIENQEKQFGIELRVFFSYDCNFNKNYMKNSNESFHVEFVSDDLVVNNFALNWGLVFKKESEYTDIKKKVEYTSIGSYESEVENSKAA